MVNSLRGWMGTITANRRRKLRDFGKAGWETLFDQRRTWSPVSNKRRGRGITHGYERVDCLVKGRMKSGRSREGDATSGGGRGSLVGESLELDEKGKQEEHLNFISNGVPKEVSTSKPRNKKAEGEEGRGLCASPP